MAKNDFLFDGRALQGVVPAANAADIILTQGASTPPEIMFVYAFSTSADEYVDFYFTMPTQYKGGGVTLKIEVRAASATSSNFRLAAAFRRRATTDDWDTTAHTYVFNEVSVIVPGTVGFSVIGTITFTDGTDMDSVVAEDQFVLRLWRNYGHGDDAAAGDMYLERFYAYETN